MAITRVTNSTVESQFNKSTFIVNILCLRPAHMNYIDSTERMCGFAAEPLQARRDAAAMSFALKLLGGKTRGELKHFVPKLIEP